MGSFPRRDAGFADIIFTMTTDSRAALEQLLTALQHHYDLAVGLDNDDVADSDLEEAEEELRDAFFSYDDALFTSTGVELPFDILDEDYDEVEEDEEDEDDPHAGLDEDDEEQVSLFDEEDLEDFDFDEDD